MSQNLGRAILIGTRGHRAEYILRDPFKRLGNATPYDETGITQRKPQKLLEDLYNPVLADSSPLFFCKTSLLLYRRRLLGRKYAKHPTDKTKSNLKDRDSESMYFFKTWCF